MQVVIDVSSSPERQSPPPVRRSVRIVSRHADSSSTISATQEPSQSSEQIQGSSLLPEWKQIEEQLRCDICKQLLDIPVSLKCCHTFCSWCIRRYLEMSGNDFCPCCRIPASSTDIKLEPRLAGILKILGSGRGKVRKQLRACLKNSLPSFKVNEIACKNETFNKQADLAESFTRIKGDPVGRTLLPLYKALNQKQLMELVCQKEGIEIPPNSTRDDIIKLHKEFLFTVQAAHDAVRMGIFSENEPSKQAMASCFNAETRLRTRREQTNVFSKRKHLVTVQEQRRDLIERSESVAALTRLASERMAEQLKQAVAKRRKNGHVAN